MASQFDTRCTYQGSSVEGSEVKHCAEGDSPEHRLQACHKNHGEVEDVYEFEIAKKFLRLADAEHGEGIGAGAAFEGDGVCGRCGRRVWGNVIYDDGCFTDVGHFKSACQIRCNRVSSGRWQSQNIMYDLWR